MSEVEYEKIGIHQVWEAQRVLASLIDFPSFDFIVGISRGGLFPAAFLATAYDKPLLTAYIDKRDNVYFDRKRWIKGKNVLLVDDICRTGKTLNLISRLLVLRTEVESVKTATIYCLNSTSFYPDFFAEKRVGDVAFPWDYEHRL